MRSSSHVDPRQALHMFDENGSLFCFADTVWIDLLGKQRPLVAAVPVQTSGAPETHAKYIALYIHIRPNAGLGSSLPIFHYGCVRWHYLCV